MVSEADFIIVIEKAEKTAPHDTTLFWYVFPPGLALKKCKTNPFFTQKKFLDSGYVYGADAFERAQRNAEEAVHSIWLANGEVITGRYVYQYNPTVKELPCRAPITHTEKKIS